MDTPKLTYRVHASLLELACKAIQTDGIAFEIKYEQVYNIVGCCILTLAKPLQTEAFINAMKSIEEGTEKFLKHEKDQMQDLLDLDRDRERIKSDMKALIFHICLGETDYKKREKQKLILGMLHSDLAKNLRPSIRRR